LDEWISLHNDPTWTIEYEQSHISMAVYGKLIARGTPDNRIIFTSDSPTPDGADWVQLHIGGEGIVEYCILEYSRGAVDIGEGTGDSVLVSHNMIRHNLWTALSIHSSSSTVTYNEIYRSGGHQGIAVIGAGSAPHIANNRIEHCLAGINIELGTSPIIEDNILINNHSGIGAFGNAVIQRNLISSPTGATYDFTYRGERIYFATTTMGNPMGGYKETQGITVSNASPTISGNIISDYGKGIVVVGNSSPSITFNNISGCSGLGGIVFEPSFLGSPGINMNNICNNSRHNLDLQPGFTGVLDAANNWWGTINETDIAKMINDNVDDPSRGTVVYKPFLTEPVELK
jgi:parallel beta-helix repeat protein